MRCEKHLGRKADGWNEGSNGWARSVRGRGAVCMCVLEKGRGSRQTRGERWRREREAGPWAGEERVQLVESRGV